MGQQDTIAVVGSGIIGAAVALALAREGRHVRVFDPHPPGQWGGSYGNVGHIAAELVEPLPSPKLLVSFWRLLQRFDGPLDLSLPQALRMFPWVAGFAAAAFRRQANTLRLAPLVLPATDTWDQWLRDINQSSLLCRHGHYEITRGPGGAQAHQKQSQAMARLGVSTHAVETARLAALQTATRTTSISGLWFPNTGHVKDPGLVVRALIDAACTRGAVLEHKAVLALQQRGTQWEIRTQDGVSPAAAVVVCAGMASTKLLAPLGLHAPLQSVRGYHVEMPAAQPYFDAPVLHTNEHIVVTPMNGRLRASSYMEFAPEGAPPDVAKHTGLVRKLHALGYPGDAGAPAWVGARPILPDYLPGIGRAPGASGLFYALGHQHIGLTLAPVTAELISDLVAERSPRVDVTAFDLRRFGNP